MSSFQNKRTNVITKVNKSFCKVCHDSGKSEAEYTSHFVKSEPGPKGVVVCPVLLASICNYCKQKGHTLKHCKELEKNKNQGKKDSYYYEKREKKEGKTNYCYRNSNNNSVFQVLADEQEVFVDKFPPLYESQLNSSKLDSTTTNSPLAFSYASMAAKAPVVVKEEQGKSVITSVFKDEKEIAKEKYLSNWLSRIDNIELEENEDYMNLGKRVTFAKSWAEWSDSEDDGEMTISELY
jgi:hypothetical protein